ncbi:Transcription initiation factor TFIID subunit 3 [Nymphaea thermarum]|nr:Transcription initiation factor TFIID subunit 3 [Nymphaea thermarum]
MEGGPVEEQSRDHLFGHVYNRKKKDVMEIAELESLLAKVLASPIELEESNMIGNEISSAKVDGFHVREFHCYYLALVIFLDYGFDDDVILTLKKNVLSSNKDLEVNVSLEDHFVQMPKETHTIACDSGAVAGDDVLKLMKDGENLPVNCDKELSHLDSSSILYCICRKPYDERPMLACDQCDEWYHFDCINLQGPPPDKFLCRACEPLAMGLMCTSPSPDEERGMGVGMGTGIDYRALSENLSMTTPPYICMDKKEFVQVTAIKFDGSNYTYWAEYMNSVLKELGYWEYVDGTRKELEEDDEDFETAYGEWDKNNLR